jgi:hypothetical protein
MMVGFTSRPRYLPGETSPGTLTSPNGRLDALKKQTFRSCRKLSDGSSVVQLVAKSLYPLS